MRRQSKRRQGGAADKAANLAGWKSPCRQLPVFRRQAYPMHAEVTKHVLLGCKYLSCPAAVCAGVGTIWEVSKLGGLNIKECLQPRKYAPRKIVFAGRSGEADPHPCWGRPMTRRKKQACALRETAVARGQASGERFSEITSGTSRRQQGLMTTSEDSLNEAVWPKERRAGRGWTHESVEATTEE